MAMAMHACSCTEVVLLMCAAPKRPACAGECAGPALSRSLNAHDFILKLNPKQYRSDAQPTDVHCVCLTQHCGTALDATASHGYNRINVTVETGAGTKLWG